MSTHRRLRTTASILALAATALAAQLACAQDSAQPAPAGAETSTPGTTGVAASQSTTAPGPTAPAAADGQTTTSVFTADTIVVTAQKRKENLQDVPVVVNVVNKQLLQDSGVQDVNDLQRVVPGLTVTQDTSPATTTARIRGVGTVGDNPGLEPSVGIVIDGVYRPRNGVGFNDLGDLDQIEVLKGPQGTLFGKSTSAGVINITTAEPTFKFGGAAELTAGNYNAIGGAAEVHGPLLGDQIAGSLYFADRQRDGFQTVVTGPGPRTRDDDEDENFYTLRGQLLYKPDSQLSVRVIGDYTHRDENCCLAVVYRESQPLSAATGPLNTQALVAGLAGAYGGEPQTPNPYNRVTYADANDPQDTVDEGISVQVDYKVPQLHGSLTSITAYRNWKNYTSQDPDFTNLDILNRAEGDQNSEQFQDFSQEIRFAGAFDKLDYLVGGFYANEYLRFNEQLTFGPGYNPLINDIISSSALGAPIPQALQLFFGPNAQFAAGQGDIDQYRQRDDSYSIFTNETYHFTSKFDVNVGVRYTIDNKVDNSLDQNVSPATGGACDSIINTPLGRALGQQLLNTVCLPIAESAFNNFANHQAESTSNTSGTVKGVYRWSPELLTYVSYAKGFKAGGFNLDRISCPNAGNASIGGPCPTLNGAPNGLVVATNAITNTSFKPEYTDAAEIGAKTTLFDRKLLLNGTLFYERFSNFQDNTYNGLVFVVDSLPYVYSKGLDTDFLYRPTRDLNFQGGLTISNTRFSHSDVSALLSSGYLGTPGERLPFAPQYSASIEATYTYHLPRDYYVRGNLGAKFNSNYSSSSDEDPRKQQPAYTVTDGRIVFGPENGAYDVELWVQNLFDTNYVESTFNAPGQNAPSDATGLVDAFLGAPRTFGATVRAKF